MQYVLLGIVIVAVVAALIYLSSRHTAAACPNCRRARVSGRTECPFCGTPYSAPPPRRKRTLPTFSGKTDSPDAAPRLVMVQGASKGKRYPLNQNQLNIGRAARNDVRIEGPLISRQHAQIIRHDGRYYLYDRESTNGTYVNGQRIAQHQLQAGDLIQFGDSILAFQVPGAATPSPPPPSRIREPLPTPISTPSHLNLSHRYVMSLIRRGGVANVYRAVSRRDNTTVAIKILHHSDPYLRDKFAQEGEIGKRLVHPHIVRIFDYGQDGTMFYIIMEFVDNGSLRDRLQPGKPLPLDFVVTTIGQTCEALAYAHQHQIVHRDIKPENILLSSTQGAKVADFGIAKLTQKKTSTVAGMIIGTPYYMSYEQAKGWPVDARSDIYSLGAVLYEMVTGRVPFTGKPLTVVHKHLTELPLPPRKVNRSIPSHVEQVILRALEKDRTKRFQTSAELAQALGYSGSVPSAPPFASRMARQQQAPAALPRRQESSAPRARLRVIQGRGRGRSLHMGGPVFVLKRREINKDDFEISRDHARITFQDGRFWLDDLDSTNGTYLNGQRVFSRAPLRRGDQIRVGRTILGFEG